MKRCSTCKQYKSDDQFGKWNTTNDGLSPTCKFCSRLRNRIYDKKRIRSKEQKLKRAEDDQKRRKQHKKKVLAQSIVRHRVAVGRIKRQCCEVCGEPDAHAHHDDYNKPFVIRWLCRIHHAEVHYGRVG